MSDRFIVTGNFTDDPFAIDMAQYIGLREDISDVVSLKTFANSEFCPRYMLDVDDMEHIGRRLEGKIVLICSVSNHERSRNDYAMRNCILARALLSLWDYDKLSRLLTVKRFFEVFSILLQKEL